MAKVFLLLLTCLFMSAIAAASEGIPALDKATDFVLNNLGAMAVAIGAVVAAVFGIFKGKLGKVMKVLIALPVICEQLARLLSAIAGFLRKILPKV